MMIIVCNRCGNYEPGDSQFCGNCRAFLEFDGTLVEGEWVDGRLARTGAAARPAEQPAPSRPSGQPAPARSAEQPPPSRPSEQPAPTRPSGQPAPAERSAEATVAQQPGEARQVIRQPRVEPVRAPTEGELRCPRCSRGNDPTRVYCRFDGEQLRPTVVAPEAAPPWWKRLWRRLSGWGRRRRDRGPAGRRFRLPTGWIVVAVLGVLAVLFNGQIRTFASWAELEIRDRVSARQPINPAKLTASSSRPGNGPERLTDRAYDLFWAPQGRPAGSWVQFDLPKPVRLLDVIITGGQHGEAVPFQRQGRPNEIDVVLTSQDGTSVTTRLAMRDQHGAQTFKVRGDRVVSVRFTFRSAYGMQADRFMAVAEVEFFYRN